MISLWKLFAKQAQYSCLSRFLIAHVITWMRVQLGKKLHSNRKLYKVKLKAVVNTIFPM